MSGRLYICPTPLGNLGDVTVRALEVLRAAEGVVCEDTRRTAKLLRHYAIEQAELISFYEGNEARRLPLLINRLREGRVLALVSDAGTPLIADPGYKLIRACVEEGIPYEALPGPTAITVALIASALPPFPFTFLGFLPRSYRRACALLRDSVHTTVAFESPRRLSRTLGALAALEPERPVAVCRELSKLHEEVLRGSAGTVLDALSATTLKGEVVLVVGPRQPSGGPVPG